MEFCVDSFIKPSKNIEAMAEERFWKEFYQLKMHIIFIQELIIEAESKERIAKIFTTITSSASIGAWVIWKELAWLWGAIIAFSQVLSAIHPHLPYKDRLKTYSSTLTELERLFIEAESMWNCVADGSMSASQINKERTAIQKKKEDIFNRNLSNSIFPSKPAISERAQIEAAKYFSLYYPMEEKDELNTEQQLMLPNEPLIESR